MELDAKDAVGMASTPCTSSCSCGKCGGASAAALGSYVYAIGRIEPRFPTPGIEKELAQVTGRSNTAGLSDRETLHAVLAHRSNRYLARQMCWVLTIQGMETYVLVPRDPLEVGMLTASLRPSPKPTDIDVVIGIRGGTAPPEMCNGMSLPLVRFDQVYSFDVDSLVDSIAHSRGDEQENGAAAEEVFLRIMNMTENVGATDADRALNYLAVRYPAIYSNTAAQFAKNCSLVSVNVSPSPLAGARKIVDVVLSYTNRVSDVTEKFYTRVDVTEEFPFLVTKLSPYFDR